MNDMTGVITPLTPDQCDHYDDALYGGWNGGRAGSSSILNLYETFCKHNTQYTI